MPLFVPLLTSDVEVDSLTMVVVVGIGVGDGVGSGVGAFVGAGVGASFFFFLKKKIQKI